MERIRVSIVITAYNVAEYIAKSIQSALQADEVIVVVDCPTDNTLEEAKKVKSKKVRIIENEQNVGAGLSRRRGIAEARGEYVMLLDGDDYIEEGYIAALWKRAEETGADIVSSGVKILNADGSWKAESYGNCVTEGNAKVARFWGERIVFMNNKIIRRSLYDLVPYSHRRYIEDTPTIIPILWYANKVEYVDNIGYVYVMRQGSLTHTTNAVKDVIYKGLCWLDLLDFFNEKDPSVFGAVNIKGFVKNIIQVLNNTHISEEDIAPYKEEWAEFSRRLLQAIKINQIDFK